MIDIVPIRFPLYARRCARGFASQHAMAQACGVSIWTYANWERGRTIPTPANQRRLARVLRVSLAQLQEER